MNGKLYIVGSPIGNLEDVTLRALATLRSVDVVYAEDTRVSRKLLDRYQIKKPLRSFREAAPRSQVDRTIEKIFEELQVGSVAYLSDAGTPGVSDPGQYLVQRLSELGIEAVPIPGPSALASLLSVSGLLASRVLFVGFLAKKKGHQTEMERLERVLREDLADGIVIYESPERILKLLGELAEWKEIELNVCIGRELTKRFEEIVRGNLIQVRQHMEAKPTIKGEISLLITCTR